jgi:cytochrome c oxidase cbb3-type subunit 1
MTTPPKNAPVAPDDHDGGIDIRLRADASSRRPALLAFGAAIVWLLLGSIWGDLASIELHWPDLLSQVSWLTFGRMRSAHLNAVNYGWASLAMIGTSLWLIPRLVHQELRWPRVVVAGIVVWNVGLLIGIGGIFAGINDGMEWLEMNRYAADPLFVIGGGMVGVALLATLGARKVRHLYVSVWYIMGAFVWFPILFLVGNLPLWSGVESAAVNWFYGHNAIGLWFASVSLGAIYYFIPKVLGQPIYSYQLSLLGFWTLAFFYPLNGMHHLIGGPLPTWMVTTSIVASVLMIIPVMALAINHHMSMVGRFGALRYSPTLRFIVLGAIAYTAVSLQGMFTALREVNRITHFTQWSVAHSHVGLYLFVTFVMFGSIYYITPRLVLHEWPSARMIRWHFWLVLIGMSIYVVGLSVFGVLQGLALLDPQATFQQSVDASLPGLYLRSLGGTLTLAGHVVFAYHWWRMVRMPAAERALPNFYEVRPVIYTGATVEEAS